MCAGTPASSQIPQRMVYFLPLACSLSFFAATCGCRGANPLRKPEPRRSLQVLKMGPGPSLQESRWVEFEVPYYTVNAAQGDEPWQRRRWSSTDPAILGKLQECLSASEGRQLSTGRGNTIAEMRVGMEDGQRWRMCFGGGWERWLYVQDPDHPKRSYMLTVSPAFHDALKGLLQQEAGTEVYLARGPDQDKVFTLPHVLQWVSPLPRWEPGPSLQECRWVEFEVPYYTVKVAQGDEPWQRRRWSSADPTIVGKLQESLAASESWPMSAGGRSLIAHMLVRMEDGQQWRMFFAGGWERWLCIRDPEHPKRCYQLTVSPAFHDTLKRLLEQEAGNEVYLVRLPDQHKAPALPKESAAPVEQ